MCVRVSHREPLMHRVRTHRDPNLSTAGSGRRSGTFAVSGARIHLGEAERLVLAVGDVVCGDGIGQFADDVQVRLALGRDEELDVARTATASGLEGVDSNQVDAVDGEDADEVGTEVRREDKLALGVEENLVGVWGLLARRIRARCRHVEGLGLDRCEGGRVGNVEPAHGRAATSPMLAYLGSQIGRHGKTYY